MRNSDDNRVDDVEKLLAEAKAFEDRKQALIAELLKQKQAAIAAFDEKLAKLGHHADSSGRTKRNHHKKPTSAAGNQSLPKSDKKS
ncbi:MAG: hypothetical protein JWO19_2271 [Bryobacterales bacterium]|nr:hypothetical protein [Bryobacterales bacterium]